MPFAPAAFSPEWLLDQLDWMTRYARRQTSSTDLAEDAVQSTWMALLERPPLDVTNPSAWLRAAIHNAIRKSIRGETRRRHREESVATNESIPSSNDRDSTRADLIELVNRLDSPYRETLSLHYFADLSTTEIASRLGRPRNTVQTHLQRGLERLRCNVDRRGRRAVETNPQFADTTRPALEYDPKVVVPLASLLRTPSSHLWRAATLALSDAYSIPESADSSYTAAEREVILVHRDSAANLLTRVGLALITDTPFEKSRVVSHESDWSNAEVQQIAEAHARSLDRELAIERQALRVLAAALALRPNYLARLGAVYSLRSLNLPDACFPLLDALLRTTPKSKMSLAWSARGFVNAKRRDYVSARECFRRSTFEPGSRPHNVFNWLLTSLTTGEEAQARQASRRLDSIVRMSDAEIQQCLKATSLDIAGSNWFPTVDGNDLMAKLAGTLGGIGDELLSTIHRGLVGKTAT